VREDIGVHGRQAVAAPLVAAVSRFTGRLARPVNRTELAVMPSLMNSLRRSRTLAVSALLLSAGLACAVIRPPATDQSGQADGREWLAGDHHSHSEFSAGYALPAPGSTEAPAPILGADGRYAITMNATRAREHGLRWMVSTDHGGPAHSRLNFEQAYPALLESRQAVPDVIQFYGMEFDTPGADHSSMIMPNTPAERQTLRDIESRYSKRDAYPSDPSRDTEPRMLEALTYMRALEAPPVVIANHPSRSARGVGRYGQDAPQELRDWNDTAPMVAIGMEGAPGHQASALNRDGSIDSTGARGGYSNSPTLGGFDQMTAVLGGFWDSMLGEGRKWYITSTSDSHRHYTEGGSDFWPGEYSKTYVRARASHADILDGLRNGRVFVTTGDLISELDVTVRRVGSRAAAAIGGTVVLTGTQDLDVTIRVRDPLAPNHRGETPSVIRVDLIMGEVLGRSSDRTLDRNPTTRVIQRFTPNHWTVEGEYLVMSHTVRGVARDSYLRVRGTNTNELEPLPDARGEDPWQDLWFYANPIFITVR